VSVRDCGSAKRFETCRRHQTLKTKNQKLNVNLENCPFGWFMLPYFITIRDTNNIKF